MEKYKGSLLKPINRFRSIRDPFEMISKNSLKLHPISPCIRSIASKDHSKPNRILLKPLITELPVATPFSARQSTYYNPKEALKPPTPHFTFSQDDIDIYKL